MFDKNQLVKVKWNNTNRKHYEKLGYIYTKRYDEFYVKAYELSKTSKAIVKATCDYCGCDYDTWYVTINKALSKGQLNACGHCAGIKVNSEKADIRIEKNYNSIIEQCNKRGYKLLTPKEDLTTIRMYITIKTPTKIVNVWAENFVRGHNCRVESYKDRNFRRVSKDTINEMINADGNYWCNPDEYTNSESRCLKIRCKCGNYFRTSYSNYKRVNVRRCPTCVAKESLGEIEVRKALEELCLSYEPEKRFADCRDKKPLPFDFYLQDYNLVIEFDGQNHFYEVFPNHAKTVIHDAIKNEYCKTHDINILRIPYWNGHKVKEIISNKIKQLNLKI